jgi:hypothetical protein
VTVNFPAGIAEEGIRAAGFHANNTLIWMEAPFSGAGANP